MRSLWIRVFRIGANLPLGVLEIYPLMGGQPWLIILIMLWSNRFNHL